MQVLAKRHKKLIGKVVFDSQSQVGKCWMQILIANEIIDARIKGLRVR